MEREGKRSAGLFQWNRGGWFGAQLGSTLWLILLGALFLVQSRDPGGLLLALGLLPNFVGLALWHRRASLAPYPAIQALIALCGACALGAMVSIWAAGSSETSLNLPSAWFLLMYPGLMLSFHLRERSARKAAV